jgi:cysteine desulfurase/selenocysteine lyase
VSAAGESLAPSAGCDALTIRADFPILSTRRAGKRLVYLDSASSAQKPRAVLDAIENCYATSYANVHRGVYELSETATRAYESVRGLTGRFIGASDRREIVFTKNVTEAINLVATSWGRSNLSSGDEILVSEMEHHANIVPWQLLCEQLGAVLRVAPITDRGEIDVEAFEAALTPRTKLVAIAHVSNVLGTVNPIRELCSLAHEHGALVLVDGAQGVPHLPVDVRELGCDFYGFTAHKLFGPTGVGVLWGRLSLLDAMPPYQGGGGMIESVSFEGTSYAEAPYRFEAGTPNIAGVAGLGAAIEYVNAIGLDAISKCEHELLGYANERLAEIEGLRIIGTAPHKVGVISMVLDYAHPHDIATVLDTEGVAVRAGHHCAQPLMRRYGVPATARASFSMYNTREDVDRLVLALQKVRELLG